MPEDFTLARYVHAALSPTTKCKVNYHILDRSQLPDLTSLAYSNLTSWLYDASSSVPVPRTWHIPRRGQDTRA